MQSLLETSILEMLGAASAPLKITQLLTWVHTHAGTLRLSWEDFVQALCNLQSQGLVNEDESGYSLKCEKTEEEVALAELAALGL
jgi:hypothetical protein